MKLSILDQSPISSQQTSEAALRESLELAKAGEALGYTRYWMTEHHDLPGLACSAPEVMLSYIGSHTKTIRLGTGAILLAHYKPYKVAEIHHMLASLFPGRIDIGVGRAPGGSAEATNALSDNFLQNVYRMPDLVKELLLILEDSYDVGEFKKLSALPLPEIPPEPWLLGTSEKSAMLAAENGLPYAFAQFMSNKDGPELITKYLHHFQPRKKGQTPQVMIAVSAICAETMEKAEKIALSPLIWGLQKDKAEGKQGVPSPQEAEQYTLNNKERETLEKRKQKMLIGSPKEIHKKLRNIQELYRADEIMIMTTTYDINDRIQSYRLIADQILL